MKNSDTAADTICNNMVTAQTKDAELYALRPSKLNKAFRGELR
jgi:hypothetical protein